MFFFQLQDRGQNATSAGIDRRFSSKLGGRGGGANSSDAEPSTVTSSPKLAPRSSVSRSSTIYSSIQQQQSAVAAAAAAVKTTSGGVTSSESAGLVGLRNIGNTVLLTNL